MLQVTYTIEELRLLEAADLAEAAHWEGLYDQTTVGEPACGTPGCLIGNYRVAHPGQTKPMFEEFWGLSDGDKQWNELFGMFGCNNAGRDGLKAAAYVRAFVEKRVKARLQE